MKAMLGSRTLASATRLSQSPRLLLRPCHHHRTISTIPSVNSTSTPVDNVDIAKFKAEAFEPALPWLFKGSEVTSHQSSLAAATKWFAQGNKKTGIENESRDRFSEYMDQFAFTFFPYELGRTLTSDATSPENDPLAEFRSWLASSSNPMDAMLAGILQSTVQPEGEESQSKYLRFEAPLLLLLRAAAFNQQEAQHPLKQLYIAQSSLPDLPDELQRDLTTPRLVQEAGKGDVYNSSIWLGLEPTYTPLHRDPNPNLFCQLRGQKTVRLLPPSTGDVLFQEIQRRLGAGSGSSRIRGTEMMEGSELIMFNAAVWGAEGPKDLVEAQLAPGDALFIPNGWWHSVKSAHLDGRLNASVNWWFR